LRSREILRSYSSAGLVSRHRTNRIVAHRENNDEHARLIVVDAHLIVGEHLLDLFGSHAVAGE
jgi:hypothetical protein